MRCEGRGGQQAGRYAEGRQGVTVHQRQEQVRVGGRRVDHEQAACREDQEDCGQRPQRHGGDAEAEPPQHQPLDGPTQRDPIRLGLQGDGHGDETYRQGHRQQELPLVLGTATQHQPGQDLWTTPSPGPGSHPDMIVGVEQGEGRREK